MTHAFLLAAMVVIRTYNYAAVAPDELARARATADRTFQQAGIAVQWVDCWVPGSSIVDRPSSIVEGPSSIVEGPSSIGGAVPRRSDERSQREGGCSEPLRDGSEFVLRLMPSSASVDQVRTMAMGSSLIDHNSGIGALTTVDPARVMNIARETGTEYPTLLGRALAHEIGHLLLGHSRHARSGLMRAIWSQEELRGIRPAGWRFSRDEAAQMRQGLAGRVRAAN